MSTQQEVFLYGLTVLCDGMCAMHSPACTSCFMSPSNLHVLVGVCCVCARARCHVGRDEAVLRVHSGGMWPQVDRMKHPVTRITHFKTFHVLYTIVN